MKRAERRHHQERKVAHARRVIETCWRLKGKPQPNDGGRVVPHDGANIPIMAKKMANNMKRCSCYACCNWRKTEGISVQEKRAPKADEF